MVVCVFLLFNPGFSSADDAAESLTFAINNFEVEGNNLLSSRHSQNRTRPIRG